MSVLRDVSRRMFLAGGAAGCALPWIISRPARADVAYPHLQGKIVTLLVGADVGGNFDLFGRAVARQFERTIPGVRIDIKNVPQASGALAARALQSGPTDGTMLFTSSTGLLSAQAQGDESVAYDLATWSWLGHMTTETRVLVRGRGSDFQDLNGLLAKTTASSMSVRSKTSYAYHEALWLNAMLGTRIKPVPGFKSVEKETALVQGEVMLTVVGYPTDRQVIDQPDVDVVLRLTEGDLPERHRSAPLLADLVKDKPGVARIAAFMNASTRLHNWMASPPNTSPGIVAEWRRAFAAASVAPEHGKELEKLGLHISMRWGEEVQQEVKDVLADVSALRAQLSAAAQCGAQLAEGEAGNCPAT